jgi:hypothetical protein
VPATPRLAIDLSGNSIRVLHGTMGGQMRCGVAALPDGASIGGKVAEPAVVAQSLKQLLARTEITESRALVAVSDAVATFRILDLPPAASDRDVGAAVAHELPLDPERIATRWTDVVATPDTRVVYAVAWDRALMKSITDTVKLAGLDAVVVELKSACLARAVTEPSCVVVDLASDPIEIVLIDRHMPRIWHSVDLKTPGSDDIASALSAPLHSVLRFYKRGPDTAFTGSSPVFVSGEQVLSPQALDHLAELVHQPVRPLPEPPRVPPHVRHSTYLTCLGLIMRRN